MTGRSMKGHLAFVSTGILFILNLVAAIGGIATIVIIFALEHAPSRIGWLLVIVGSFTMAAGILGVLSSNRRGCFSWHLVLLVFSLIGLIVAALVIFFRPTQVLNAMHSKNSETSGRKLIKLEAAIFFVVFCIDVMVAILGVCVHCCDLVDYYEDIELTNRSSGHMQSEAERAARREDSKASQLAQKMRDKYGKWTGVGGFVAGRRT